MIKNAKAKGGRREREVRDIFLDLNYDVTKGGGSLGVFDLVCVRRQLCPAHKDHTYFSCSPVIVIQVKSTRISSMELCEIGMHETIAQKQVWIKKDFKPWQYAVIEDGV